MKINFYKNPGGVLTPADDMEVERLTKFKTGEMYEVEIKLVRNPAFHRKMFAFLKFCFAHWECPDKYVDEKGQFEFFRKELTKIAGYHKSRFCLDGSVVLEAMSLSFAQMSQEEFESCYQAMITAACKTVFKDADQETEDKLLSFF